MTRETDRITVPANGRKPHPVADAPTQKATSPELTIAVTPGQLAVGFSVIAGIILLVLRRRHGRRRD
jgi:hypothetical protein